MKATFINVTKFYEVAIFISKFKLRLFEQT